MSKTSPTDFPLPDLIVDALGLRCPLPVLRARKRLEELPSGAVLCLLADDPMAEIDLPHLCQEAGHEFLGLETDADGLRLFLRKGG